MGALPYWPAQGGAAGGLNEGAYAGNGWKTLGPTGTTGRSPPIAGIQIDKDEPACAGSKHLHMFALSLVHERGELFKL